MIDIPLTVIDACRALKEAGHRWRPSSRRSSVWESRRLYANNPVAEMTRMSLYFNALEWAREFD